MALGTCLADLLSRKAISQQRHNVK
jgi:hypothetical protein